MENGRTGTLTRGERRKEDVLPVGVGRLAANKVAESVKEEAQCSHQTEGNEGLFSDEDAKLLLGRHKLRVVKGRVASALLTRQSHRLHKGRLIGPFSALLRRSCLGIHEEGEVYEEEREW